MVGNEIELVSSVDHNQEDTERVNMPKKLSAENGSKALMIGEFFVEVEVPSEEYCGCDECDYCINVQDYDASPTVMQKVPVSWDMIKDIYDKLVEFHAK
jgi:hypothetical protein